MERLIVKNFGPLKSIDIELNKISLFIGENGSGKSVLGKLITVLFNFYDNMNFTIENFKKLLNEYKINYLSKEAIIELSSINTKKEQIILIENLEIKYGDIVKNFRGNYKELKKIKNIIQNTEGKPYTNIAKQIDEINKRFNKMQSRYIPSERNFVSIISQSLSSFIVSEIPLPKFFLQFASDFENGANQIQEINFLNVKYIYGDGLDRHKVYFDDKNYLPLNESSSGIQAVIPLLITYKYFTQKYYFIIIEEPEQNLFPKAQKEVVDFLIENLQESKRLFLMTHSPYILTALNNLILANDVKEAKGEEAIKGIVKTSQCIPFEDINAYYIKDGKAINIMDKENRLIGVNVIDEISDEVNETFDILLSKLD